MNKPQLMSTAPNYNQWRAMLAITRASLRSMTRSPSAVVFSLAFPLVFIVVFGFIKSNTIQLDVSFAPETDTRPIASKMPGIDINPSITRMMTASSLRI